MGPAEEEGVLDVGEGGWIEGCRICGGTDLALAVDLGEQPWCNHFLRPEEVGTEPLYPLRVVYCASCCAAQLDYTVPKEVMFSDHTYLSGTTRSLSEHFGSVAQEVTERFMADGPTRSVLDIGSNDGTQLRHFQKLGYDVLGVESSKPTAALANQAGVPTLNAFFDLEFARGLDRQFDLINAAGVFFHLEDLHPVTQGIREVLKQTGVFVIQFIYMQQLMGSCAFDQIYHEHLLYYTLRSLEALVSRHGLELFDAYLSPIHGGSVIAFAGHGGLRPPSERLVRLRQVEDEQGSNELEAYLRFARRIEAMKRDNLAYLNDARQRGKRVFGLGAPAKGNTLLNHFGIGPDLVQCLVERNPLRGGLISPGMHIPIVFEEDLEEQPDIYYVLAWNFRDEILTRYRDLIAGGVQFYFPVTPRGV